MRRVLIATVLTIGLSITAVGPAVAAPHTPAVSAAPTLANWNNLTTAELESQLMSLDTAALA